MTNAIRSIGDRLLEVIVPRTEAKAAGCTYETYYNGCYHSAWCPLPNGCDEHWVKAARGDNPAMSVDSRTLGFFAADNVIGVVLRTLGPMRTTLPIS